MLKIFFTYILTSIVILASPLEKDGNLLRITHAEGDTYIHPKQLLYFNIPKPNTIELYLSVPRIKNNTTIPNITVTTTSAQQHQAILIFLKLILRNQK